MEMYRGTSMRMRGHTCSGDRECRQRHSMTFGSRAGRRPSGRSISPQSRSCTATRHFPRLSAEIGSNPCRDRSISGSRSVVPVRGAMSRGWGSYESGLTVAGQPCRCSHAPGAVVTAITQHEEPCPDAHARPGAVEVAHSCTPHISRNRGIMRNSNVSNGHGPAPMCADPPHRTWEPDRHAP